MDQKSLREFNEALTEEEIDKYEPPKPPKLPKVQKGEIWEVEVGRYKVVSVEKKGKFLKLRRV